MEKILNLEPYCGWRFIRTGTPHAVYSPYTRALIGQTFLAGIPEVEKAIVAAQEALPELADLPVYKKYAILSGISHELEGMKHEFARIISLESGKPYKYALAEAERSAQVFRVAAEESKRLPAEYLSLDWTPAAHGKEGFVKHFPVGIVAGISPFNFPLNLAVHKIAPAIAAGCPIILKPSGSTPLSTLMLARLLDSSELPKGSVSVLPMDRATGNRLVTDERISMLSFTGSPEVGWKMKRDAGRKKVVLELGGNAGVIVGSGADIPYAAMRCLNGAFSYSGQVCIHTQRIYVLKEYFDSFASLLNEGASLLRQGDPLDPATDISVMIDEANAVRVEEWIGEAVSRGARVLGGGRRNGSFVEPTILTNTLETMKVACEEIFGPVVIVEPVSDFSEGIARVNAGKFGLQAGVFTDSIREMDMAFALLRVGGVVINDVPTFRADHMPYGGIKDSGQGREGVKYAIMEMTEPKILVKSRG